MENTQNNPWGYNGKGQRGIHDWRAVGQHGSKQTKEGEEEENRTSSPLHALKDSGAELGLEQQKKKKPTDQKQASWVGRKKQALHGSCNSFVDITGRIGQGPLKGAT